MGINLQRLSRIQSQDNIVLVTLIAIKMRLTSIAFIMTVLGVVLMHLAGAKPMDKPQNTEDETPEPRAADWSAIRAGIPCSHSGGQCGWAGGPVCCFGYHCQLGSCVSR